MKTYKIKIKHPSQSEAVQRKAFELGYTWSDHRTLIQDTDKPYLFMESDQRIRYSVYTETYNTDSAEEISVRYFLKLGDNKEYDAYVFDSKDPILWRAFVDRLKSVYNCKFYNEESMGMNDYSFIHYSKPYNSIVRSYSKQNKDILTVDSFSDLDKIKKAEPELPHINEYDGKHTKDSGFVQYGCAEIPIHLICEIVKLYRQICNIEIGNRNLKSITLDSGVEISIEDLIKIYEYYKHVSNIL